jgi:hypothetical protein
MDTICNEVDSEYTVTIKNEVKSKKLPCIWIRQVCEVHALSIHQCDFLFQSRYSCGSLDMLLK